MKLVYLNVPLHENFPMWVDQVVLVHSDIVFYDPTKSIVHQLDSFHKFLHEKPASEHSPEIFKSPPDERLLSFKNPWDMEYCQSYVLARSDLVLTDLSLQTADISAVSFNAYLWDVGNIGVGVYHILSPYLANRLKLIINPSIVNEFLKGELPWQSSNSSNKTT